MLKYLTFLTALSVCTASPSVSSASEAIQPASKDWPNTRETLSRWSTNSPYDLRPFVVVALYFSEQIAIRYTVDRGGPGTPTTHYVAMRQGSGGLEEADSRECAFGDLIRELSYLEMPKPYIPGAPVENMPYPPGGHGGASLIFPDARQVDGQHARITLSANYGAMVVWALSLFQATNECWKPTTPPSPK